LSDNKCVQILVEEPQGGKSIWKNSVLMEVAY